MPRIDSLTEESWRLIVSDSNQAAMRKSHQYPRYEGQFLEDCCTFQQPECTPSCFCRRVGCRGVWTLRPEVKFQDLLSHYCNLWLRVLRRSSILWRMIRGPGCPRSGKTPYCCCVKSGGGGLTGTNTATVCH